MKLSALIIFTIVSICLIFSVAKSQEITMEDCEVNFIECKGYNNNKCTGSSSCESRKNTISCFVGRFFSNGLYEKIEFNSCDNITVYTHRRGGCTDTPQSVTVFSKNVCKWDETIGMYVSWDWY